MTHAISSTATVAPPVPQPRPGVAAIPAYIPGEHTAGKVARVVKLASNESPLGASPLAMRQLEAAGAIAHLYPDAQAVRLRETLANKHCLLPDQIVCGCGSEDLLHLVARAFVDTGDEVVVSEYGFIGHHIAAMAAGARVVKVPEKDYRVDLDAMSAAVSEKTKLIYIANPGNPTGTMLSFAALEDFHASLPPSVILVIDAAYAEFAQGIDGYESGLSLINGESANVFVTRTFSKMYGLAALRVGWGYGSPEIVANINRVRLPFNANALGQAAAIAATDDDEFVARVVTLNERGLAQLTSGLRALGLEVTPSVCNFVLVHFPAGSRTTALQAFDDMRELGVIVRPVAGYGLPDSLRISVGTEEENRICLATLREVLAAT